MIFSRLQVASIARLGADLTSTNQSTMILGSDRTLTAEMKPTIA